MPSERVKELARQVAAIARARGVNLSGDDNDPWSNDVIDELHREGIIGAVAPDPEGGTTVTLTEKELKPGDEGVTAGGIRFVVDERGYRRDKFDGSPLDWHSSATSPTVQAQNEAIAAEARERDEYAAKVAAAAEERLSSERETARFEADVEREIARRTGGAS